NEDTDEESLGGADMHSRVSGVSDYLAEDEVDAIRLGREIVAHLNWRKLGEAKMATPEAPRYDPDELLGIGSIDVRKPFEVREVIARVVDGSRLEEFKPTYGTTLVTGWAHLHGYPIGILGNNGILFSDSSEKAAQFIQLCNKIDVPLLFLQNITGYMVGTQYERGGIIKDGAKMINAVSNSTVPMFTVMIGSSYGAGNYGMCGRAYEPRFLFTWPNHRIAVMGPEQLAGVLSIVRRGAAERAGQLYDEAEDQAVRRTVEQQIEQESNAFYATARIWDDGIIDPRDGFLAENADFAEACAQAGVVFIGPPPDAIRRMGSKIEAKRIMAAAGVPVVPGFGAEGLDEREIAKRAQAIGYPVLVKASAGGGGKGMRLVDRPARLAPALEAARREAKSAFGDDTLLVERYVGSPRHVEIQI